MRVIDRPVPIDMQAIKALKQSPMALDIYTSSTYRAAYLKWPTVIPWASWRCNSGLTTPGCETSNTHSLTS